LKAGEPGWERASALAGLSDKHRLNFSDGPGTEGGEGSEDESSSRCSNERTLNPGCATFWLCTASLGSGI
jgi:hypothetical protein